MAFALFVPVPQARANEKETARNKAIVRDFYSTVLIRRDIDAAPRFLRTDYIQHNPQVPTGLKGFMDTFRERFAQKLPPEYKRELLNVVGENEMVVIYVFCLRAQFPDSGIQTVRLESLFDDVLRRRYRTFILIAALGVPPAEAQSDHDILPQVVHRLHGYLTRATESSLFSGTVAVARNGRIVFNEGFGLASVAYGIPNTPDTRLDIGSVSKTFTAATVLRLQEQGKLSVDDPICKFLPEYPPAWQEITIRHLLNHTSGILNYTELSDQYEMRALASFIPDAMKRIRSMPLQFSPGQRFSYSNTGYKLLHEVVRNAAGRPYEQVLEEEILRPLQMNGTGFLEAPGVRHVIIKNLATGYTDGVGSLGFYSSPC